MVKGWNEKDWIQDACWKKGMKKDVKNCHLTENVRKR